MLWWSVGVFSHSLSDCGESFHGLAGEFSDEVEVLVEVQDRQAGEFGGRRDQEVGYRGRAVLSAIGQEREYLNGPVLDGGCRVLDGHVGEGRVAQAGAEITRRSGGVANFQAGDGGDVYESAFDSVRPGVCVRACAQAGES
jgi:hypothetical protein